jgi:uncharacterized membrane protein YhaH (DUF805 family)
MNYYLQALSSKYADFSSRSRRSEYWFFTLFSFLAAIILTMVDIAIGTFDYKTEVGLLASIYGLLVLIPTLAVTVRRLHDIGKSGWAMFIVYASMCMLGFFTMFFAMLSAAQRMTEEQFGLAIAMLVITMIGLIILFLVWLCTDSQPGRNRFGENPKNNPASN